jgi:hypothetical protein
MTDEFILWASKDYGVEFWYKNNEFGWILNVKPKYN